MLTIVRLFLCFALGDFVVRAAENSVPSIVITAPAKPEPGGEWIYLTISDAKHSHELPCVFRPPYNGPVALESNRVYKFTLIKEPYKTGRLISHVVKVEQDGKMIYDREVCEAHHVKMERKEVKIIYGLIVRDAGGPTSETVQRLFPHGHEIAFGGCAIMPGSLKTEKIYVCSECRKAYEKWASANQKTK
jgi:hypothetical protein